MNSTAPFKFSIVLSCQPTSFQAVTFKGEFEGNLRFLSELGYDGVELAIRNPREIDYPKLYRLLDLFGLQVPAIGTGQAWGEEHLSFTDPNKEVREAAIQRILDHIPYAAQLNALVIIGLVRGKIQEGISLKQAWDWMVDGVKRCTLAAAQMGVCLCLEPINAQETNLINTIEDGLELVQQVSLPNLGILLDTYHLHKMGEDVNKAICKTGKHLFHVHVADSNRWYPGAGNISFNEVMQALKDVNYKGYVSGEFLPLPDPDSAAKRGLSNLRELCTTL